MAASDPWKRYFEAGLEFSELTRKRAEAIVKDLVKQGEIQRAHQQQRVEDLLERSRVAAEAMAASVRTEVTRQLTDLGLVKAPVKKAAKKATAAAKKSTGTAKKTVKKAAATAKKATGQS